MRPGPWEGMDLGCTASGNPLFGPLSHPRKSSLRHSCAEHPPPWRRHKVRGERRPAFGGSGFGILCRNACHGEDEFGVGFELNPLSQIGPAVCNGNLGPLSVQQRSARVGSPKWRPGHLRSGASPDANPRAARSLPQQYGRGALQETSR